jgi:hypothetical protein
MNWTRRDLLKVGTGSAALHALWLPGIIGCNSGKPQPLPPAAGEGSTPGGLGHQRTLGRNPPRYAPFAQSSLTDFGWWFILNHDDQKCEMKHNYASSKLKFSVRKAALRPIELYL